MTQHDTLTQALQQIADWDSHTTECAVEYGSNGVRDFYRNIAHAAISATQPAQAAQPVSRDVIRDVFLRNGFTIKDGCSDLKPYVYAAANALLEVAAAQPVQGVPEDFVRIPRPAFDKAASALRQYSQAPVDYHRSVLRMRDALRELTASPTPPAQQAAQGEPDGMVPAPHYRGYAVLGIGEYLINHTPAGDPAELVISIASDADKDGRVVGDERDNLPGAMIQPEQMAVRVRFENVAGLDALEGQLRYVRGVHFPGSIKHPAVAQGAGEVDTGPRVLREVLSVCEDTMDKMALETTEFSRGRAFEAKGISRAIGTWFQDEFCGLSHMGEPVAAPTQPAAGADVQLLDAMERHRIAVVPEFEGTWDASVYGDEGEPQIIGSGDTPRDAIRAAIAASKKGPQ